MDLNASYMISPHLKMCKPLVNQPRTLYGIEELRRRNLSALLHQPLDRVNVLGNDEDYGHTGCVNALSWAQDGDLLLSGGDDTTVRLWRIDPSNVSQEYPFVSTAVIRTGHRANIFSAQMLPYSNRIATAAGDNQVRVFDVKSALATTPVSDTEETLFTVQQTCVAIIRCHHQRVKRIITEESPDIFLSLSEDGTVRQHDLRVRHSCRSSESCPAPLVEMDFDLSTISLSPLTPYQLVVAGESPYGYLFDRRHLRKKVESQWGRVPSDGGGATTCVRRFGRDPRAAKGRASLRSDHITGCRVSPSNGHEVLLSYSGDGVYLFSTLDQPASSDVFEAQSPSPIPAGLSPTNRQVEEMQHDEDSDDAEDSVNSDTFVVLDELGNEGSQMHQKVPIVLPRRRYVGARNVATVKDVNFIGPKDEWVVSGSDDGNVFIWDKMSSQIVGIYEGDSSVVNMVEAHPHFPLIAVSGIDTTVKLFAPNHLAEPSKFSRISEVDSIVETNQRPTRPYRPFRINLSSLLSEIGHPTSGRRGEGLPDCTPQ